MLSKKGYSCASCDKGLMNLHGSKVDFMPWGNLPFKEQSVRVGGGYSKLHSMIDSDQIRLFEKAGGFKEGKYVHYTGEGDGLLTTSGGTTAVGITRTTIQGESKRPNSSGGRKQMFSSSLTAKGKTK